MTRLAVLNQRLEWVTTRSRQVTDVISENRLWTNLLELIEWNSSANSTDGSWAVLLELVASAGHRKTFLLVCVARWTIQNKVTGQLIHRIQWKSLDASDRPRANGAATKTIDWHHTPNERCAGSSNTGPQSRGRRCFGPLLLLHAAKDRTQPPSRPAERNRQRQQPKNYSRSTTESKKKFKVNFNSFQLIFFIFKRFNSSQSRHLVAAHKVTYEITHGTNWFVHFLRIKRKFKFKKKKKKIPVEPVARISWFLWPSPPIFYRLDEKMYLNENWWTLCVRL